MTANAGFIASVYRELRRDTEIQDRKPWITELIRKYARMWPDAKAPQIGACVIFRVRTKKEPAAPPPLNPQQESTMPVQDISRVAYNPESQLTINVAGPVHTYKLKWTAPDGSWYGFEYVNETVQGLIDSVMADYDQARASRKPDRRGKGLETLSQDELIGQYLAELRKIGKDAFKAIVDALTNPTAKAYANDVWKAWEADGFQIPVAPPPPAPTADAKPALSVVPDAPAETPAPTEASAPAPGDASPPPPAAG